MPAKRPELERFWEKVAKTDGCWEWTAGRFRSGYGAFHRDGRALVYAHRFAYEITHGEPPGDLLVCHSCDNRRCVNPAHLFLGTNAENVRDAVAKGRHATGTRNGHARLTPEAILAIRASDQPQSVLARNFGVSQPIISRIRAGKIWASV